MRRVFTISFLDHEGRRVTLRRAFYDTESYTAREQAEYYGRAYSYEQNCHIEEITDGQ